jgi:pheromone shutdown protein TraB
LEGKVLCDPKKSCVASPILEIELREQASWLKKVALLVSITITITITSSLASTTHNSNSFSNIIQFVWIYFVSILAN